MNTHITFYAVTPINCSLSASKQNTIATRKKPKQPVTLQFITEKPKSVNTPQTKPTASRTNSKENIPDDNVSQTSIGGGIKGKLAALFSKEQTISETTIANKNKQERNKEMEMLQNRFNYKVSPK